MTPTRIPHDGSACPVSPGTRVLIYMRSGGMRQETARFFASKPDWWKHEGYPETNIIAYSILEPDWAAEGPRLLADMREILRIGTRLQISLPSKERFRALTDEAKIANAAIDRIEGIAP